MRRKKQKSKTATQHQSEKRNKRRLLKMLFKRIIKLFNSPKPVDLAAEYPDGWS